MYNLHIICKKEEKKIELNFTIEFLFNEKDYGNGTYMSVDNTNPDYSDYYFDIRYDHSYDKNNQMKYITDWALSNWNGENGAYKIVYITCYEAEEE